MDVFSHMGEPQEFKIPDALYKRISDDLEHGDNPLDLIPQQKWAWLDGEELHLRNDQFEKLRALIREEWLRSEQNNDN